MSHNTDKPNESTTDASGPKQWLADFICPSFFSYVLNLLTGLSVHPRAHLARTWSVAEANQGMVARDNTGARRHESTRSTQCSIHPVLLLRTSRATTTSSMTSTLWFQAGTRPAPPPN